MRVYNKLVRDRIPDIIEKNGQKCGVRPLSGGEYREYLSLKLREEVAEYERDGGLDELADILEVVRALAALEGADAERLEKARAEKAEKRGGFNKRLLLIDVED